jgi:hypothetical protein
MRRALMQDIELMPQCQISASNRLAEHADKKEANLQSSGDHVLIRC